MTFGYKRSGILAAVINSSVLIIIGIAIFGIVANSLGAFLLHTGSDEDMNIKSIYLHLFGDALSSLGVVVGGIGVIKKD